MTGAMFIAECLKQEGVEKVFGQCGHTNYALIDATGHYVLRGQPPGTHVVRYAPANPHVQTDPVRGTDGLDPGRVVTLSAGQDYAAKSGSVNVVPSNRRISPSRLARPSAVM